jgi:hypothetical protein
VKRDWHQPSAVVRARSSAAGSASSSGNGCDRFLASPAVLPTIPGGYVTLDAFTAFPRASLVPGQHIVVEFDYAFNTAPSGGTATYVIDVRAPFPGVFAQNLFIGVGIPTDQSGHMMFTLSTIGNQNTFILANQDPNGLSINITSATGTTSLTITNVCIKFNQ